MLVSADRQSWNALGDTLEAAGIGLRCVASGADALETIEHWQPTFLLLNAEISDIDCFSLCRRIRAMERFKTIPIVITGGEPTADFLRLAQEAGGTTVVPANLPWEYFPQQIHRALAIAGMRQALSTAERRYQILLDVFPDFLFILNADGMVIDQLGRRDSSIGDGPVTLVGKTIDEALPAGVADIVKTHLNSVLTTGAPQTYEFKQGGHYFEARLRRQSDSTVFAVVRNVTERRRELRNIWNLAFLDQLTGLPNLTRFRALLGEAIPDHSDGAAGPAVLLIELDRFRRLYDSFGYRLGDALLVSASSRLKRCLQAFDTARLAPGVVARAGGSEYAVLLPTVSDPAVISEIAHRIQEALSAPYVHAERQLVITASIGVAQYPRDGRSAAALLRSANVALQRATTEGRNSICWYSKRLLAQTVTHLHLEAELRGAIEHDGLSLVYQPKVNLVSGAVSGVEALLRWEHPTRGFISPEIFIPVAEDSGLIVQLGDWVLRQACQQLGEWLGRGFDVELAINASNEQICSGDFVARVLAVAQAAGIRPEQLQLEITESLLMRDVAESIDALRALRAAGLRLAVDDFGTGHSSLSYLRDLPLDTLKIDRSFIEDLAAPNGRAIYAAVVAMARELGLKVIAEGVENREQLGVLRGIGCDEIQGFVFSAPLAPGELEALLREQAEKHQRQRPGISSSKHASLATP